MSSSYKSEAVCSGQLDRSLFLTRTEPHWAGPLRSPNLTTPGTAAELEEVELVD